AKNSLGIAQVRLANWTVNNVLNYEKEISDGHTISAMAGFEAIKNNGRSIDASDMDFPVQQEELIFIGNGLGTKLTTQSEFTSSLASFFGRLNYDYKGKY
ncbi:MAG: hypothetical protein GX098_06695, partial [Bacteroidales bacterium]|nr:hypothetical protein [Bacteroidales bacterium]